VADFSLGTFNCQYPCFGRPPCCYVDSPFSVSIQSFPFLRVSGDPGFLWSFSSGESPTAAKPRSTPGTPPGGPFRFSLLRLLRSLSFTSVGVGNPVTLGPPEVALTPPNNNPPTELSFSVRGIQMAFPRICLHGFPLARQKACFSPK